MSDMKGKKVLFAKPRYSLGFLHKLGVGILLVLAVSFLFQPQAYRKDWENVPSLYFS